ncbi:RAS oncogene family member Rab21 [Dermatophagoides farinae]|uniref:Ras-related protein Rab-21 n=2 Tax=Dermatophagoides farinae TaxID=6954 RepID=A0A922L2V4_DERFA|nr:ras-related protein Rab-21-like [Dermatophagoides farinae]KAH9506471.1 Ras- protein Rab-21 [Dermatophagoides farinae]
MKTMAMTISNQQFKIVLLGEGCVGKTSLVLRYVENKFSETNQSTLQASFLTKNIFVQNMPITLNIWDTAGQERFHAVGPLYYRDSNGALLVYDVTDPDSLAKVKVWIKELRKVLGNDVCIAIIGNKIDLLSGLERDQMNNVLIAEAQSYATTAGATHYCTSAKTNYGIDDVFLNLTKQMISFNQTQQLNPRALNSTVTRGISIAADNEINNPNDLQSKRRCC